MGKGKKPGFEQHEREGEQGDDCSRLNKKDEKKGEMKRRFGVLVCRTASGERAREER